MFMENQEHAVIFEILFLIGNRSKISPGIKPFWGEIYFVLSQGRKVVESSNLVKLVIWFVKKFLRKNRAKRFPTWMLF